MSPALGDGCHSGGPVGEPRVTGFVRKGSQADGSLVAALLAEQKNADHDGAVLRLVRSGSQRQPEPGARVLDGAAARVLAGRRRRSWHDARPGMRLVASAIARRERAGASKRSPRRRERCDCIREHSSADRPCG